MYQNSIVKSLFKTIRENENNSAFENESMSLNYRQLGRLIGAIVIRLKENRLTQGALLGIYADDPRLAIASAMAANWLGVPWIEVNYEALNAENFKITHTICLFKDSDKFKHNRKLIVTDEWTNDSRIDFWQEIYPFEGFKAPKTIARVNQSSGTTGRKKFILRTAESEYNSYNKDYYYNNNKRRLVCLLPPLSAGGFNARLRNLLLGGANISVNKNNFNLYQVDTVLGSPFHLNEILKAPDSDKNLKVTDAILMGGGVTNDFVNRLHKIFDSVHITYASTEIGMVGSKEVKNMSVFDNKMKLVSDKNLIFEIIDQDENICPLGKVGIVRLKRHGENVIYTDKTQSEWFYPGDAGIRYKDNEFSIVGRVNDSLNINGTTINALDVDDIIQSNDFVEDGYCFIREGQGGINELHLIAKFTSDQNQESNTIMLLKIVSKYVPETAIPKSVFIVDTVPRTNTGKPIRHKIAKMLDQKINMENNNV